MIYTKQIKITKKLVRRFADVTGDKNPLHLDKNYAKTTCFGKPIAHGMLLGSLISRLIAEKYPGPGSIYLSQNLEFVSPCFIGETITIYISLIEQVISKYYITTNIFDSIGNLLIKGNALILKK